MPAHRPHSGLDILVVDNEPDILESLQDALGGHGHRVTSARDAEQAMRRLAGHRFDLAICDVRSAKVDGLDLFQRIRLSQPASELILMGAFGNLAEAADEPAAPTTHYLAKPFRLERLLQLVERVAEGQLQPSSRNENGPVTNVGALLNGPLQPLAAAIKQFEREYLLRALDHCSWQRTRTAGLLGISRKTLWQKLRQHRVGEGDES
jgi:DNA-binding NtrC family response regulator